MNKKAVVLLSGGLDSATTLFLAQKQGFQTFCLIIDYGQRHKGEIERAQKIAHISRSVYKKINITLPWKGSALLDRKIRLPQSRSNIPDEIPNTYVPARNLIFLSFAASYAEAIGAEAVFIGANAVDYSGYPDCRPEFYQAFQRSLQKGLKAGVDGKAINIHTPLIRKTKAQIIKSGMLLGVPYEHTWSCYRGGVRPCGKCDSCLLRVKGFSDAGYSDPALEKRSRGRRA